VAVIEQLEIQDFGPFESVALPMAPLTVLVGPNDSGKSSMLNAIRVLAGLHDRDTSDRVCTQMRKGASQARISATARVGDALWGMAYGFGERGRRGRPALLISLDGEPLDESVKDQLKSEGVDSGHWNWPWGFVAGGMEGGRDVQHDIDRLNSLHRLLAGVHFLKPNPDAMRRPSRVSTGQEGIALLGPDGSGLPSLLAQLAVSDPSRAVAVLQAFSQQVPTLSGYQVGSTELDGSPAYTLRFRGTDGATYTADEVSDGVILILGFLALAHLPEPPSILLVEEPENGMHPARLREILTQLRKLSSGQLGDEPTQVILTTHMPYLLDEVEPEEAAFCVRGPDGLAHCVRFADVPGVREELRLKHLGELWAEHGEEALYERWQQRPAAK